MTKPQPLIINEWSKGIGDSTSTGFGMLKKVDIESFPGAVKVKNKVFDGAILITSGETTFKYDDLICGRAVNSLITATETAIGYTYNGAAVTFSTTNTLPAEITSGTIYFLKYNTTKNYEIGTTLTMGTTLSLSGNGTGTHTVTAVPMGDIKHIVKDTRTGYYFAIDDDGRVWLSKDTGTTFRLLTGNTIGTAGSGKGLVLFHTSDNLKTYLFAFAGDKINVINVYGDTEIDTPSWTNGWKTLNSGAGSTNSHHAIVGEDNNIYFCDDRYVGMIRETPGDIFDPADAASFTFNSQALDLPQGEIANWLDEYGIDLWVAGLNRYKIYSWDRISDSFGFTLTVPERGVYHIKNIGNIVYILAGQKGNVYYSLGSSVKLFKKIPWSVLNPIYTQLTNVMSWSGIGSSGGSLLVPVSSNGGTGSSSGVFRIYEDGRILLDQQTSSGVAITAIYAEDDWYIMGYAGGIDHHVSTIYSAYEGVIESALYRVGNKTEKAMYTDIEVQIGKTISTGTSNIRIKYRTDLRSDFADFPNGAVAFSLSSTATSFSASVGLTKIENIQLQIELDGAVELLEVRLTP
jgi:hypothetical protein